MQPWLREKRKAAGLTQSKTALRAGISQTYYAQIEAGKRGNRLPVNTAKRIALVLGFDWTLFYAEKNQ